MATEQSPRADIIRAVTTPLNFLVLGMLIVEAALGGLALQLTDQRWVLTWGMILFLLLFVATVVVLAVQYPGVLEGNTWPSVYVTNFADDLYAALDGSIANLTPVAQQEAWANLRSFLEEDTHGGPAAYRAFRIGVATRISKRSNLKGTLLKNRGPLVSRV